LAWKAVLEVLPIVRQAEGGAFLLTQEQRLLDFLQNGGTITVAEAPSVLGIGSLTRRVTELRRSGHEVKSAKETKINQFGELVRFNRYYM
jgi:hypothetical protein